MNLELRPFESAFADTVVSWIATDRDLLWLAPRTEPPLTRQKVIDWNGERNTMHLLFADGQPVPCAYGETNRMQRKPGQIWLGHLIVDPEIRGRGIGLGLVRLLLEKAFEMRDVKAVALVVFPANLPAIRCYLNAGFTQTRDEYHRFRPDRKHRMIRMDLARQDWLMRDAATATRAIPK